MMLTFFLEMVYKRMDGKSHRRANSMKPIAISLNSSVYSITAIRNALFGHSDKFFIKINEDNLQIVVEVMAKDGSSDFPVHDFYNNLLDCQIRLDTEKEFKVIREMIVAQAFEPCDNLKDVISHLIP